MKKNDYTYKFHLPMMDEDIKLHLESTLQKRIRLDWQKAYNSQAIIVINLVIMKSKHYTIGEAQIVKLNITEEEKTAFMSIVNKVCEPLGSITPSTKKEKPKKQIAQYGLNGNLIKIWDSQTQAAKALGIGQANISLCANGKRANAGGFIFEKIVNDYGEDI